MVEMGTSWESGEEINKESKFKKKQNCPKKKHISGPNNTLWAVRWWGWTCCECVR